MAKIAGIGSQACLLPLKYLGADVFLIPDEGEPADVLKRVVESEEYAVVLVTEKVYNEGREYIESRKESYLPAITLIPDETGSTGIALDRITNAIRTAVGLEIG